MSRTVLTRIGVDIVITILVVQGWWFVALPIALIGAWKFASFIELVCAGVMYDSLFGFVPGIGITEYAGTLLAVLLYCTISVLKRVVRK